MSQQTKGSSSLNGAVAIQAQQWMMCFLCSQPLDFTPIQILRKSAHVSVEGWTDLQLAALFCIAPFPFSQSKKQFEKANFSSEVKELKRHK